MMAFLNQYMKNLLKQKKNHRAPAIPLSRFVAAEYDDYEVKLHSIKKIKERKNSRRFADGGRSYIFKNCKVYYCDSSYFMFSVVYKKFQFTLNDYNCKEMWRTAGCNVNYLFKLQLRSGILYSKKKFPTVEIYKKFVEVQKWIWNNWGDYTIDVKNALRFYSLPGPLRKAPLFGATKHSLNWEKVRRVQNLLKYFNETDTKVKFILSQDTLDDESLRPEKYRKTLRVTAYGAEFYQHNHVGLAEWNRMVSFEQAVKINEFLGIPYPKLPFEYSELLIGGMTPVEICKGLLSKSEAHEFLSQFDLADPPSNIENAILNFLVKKLATINSESWSSGRTGDLHYYHTSKIRSVKTVRWISFVFSSKNRCETLFKKITNRLPGGETKEFIFLDIIDEVQDSDIRTGKDRVYDVMKRASARKKLAHLNRIRYETEPLNRKLPQWAKCLPEGFTLLNTNSALVKEGDDLSHCVGTYGEAVKLGQSYIISISMKYIDENNEEIIERSTVEIDQNGCVRQHLAYNNATPHNLNQDALDIWLGREFRMSYAA